jgi:hypothetical protein
MSKILDSSNFGSSAGFTVYQLSTGTVSFGGNSAIFSPSNDGLNKTGLVRTVGTTSDPFVMYRWKWQASSNAGTMSFMIYISQSATFTFSGVFGIYVNGGGTQYIYDNGAVDVGLGVINSGIDYDVKIVANANRTYSLYINDVFKFKSINFAGTTVTHVPIYWQANCDAVNGTSGTLKTSVFAIEDQAQVEIERSLTGGGVGFSQVGLCDLGTQTFIDTSALALTNYYYRVRTNRGGDLSPYSDEYMINSGTGDPHINTMPNWNTLLKEYY